MNELRCMRATKGFLRGRLFDYFNELVLFMRERILFWQCRSELLLPKASNHFTLLFVKLYVKQSLNSLFDITHYG